MTTHRRTLHAAVLTGLALATVVPMHAGICAPACESWTRGNIPFELEMKSQDNSSYASKVYRGDDLFRTEVKDVAGHPSKALFQGNFVLVTPLPDGSSLASLYDVPTNTYIWDQKARLVHVGTNVPGRPLGNLEQTYQILGDEDVSVGDCAFKSKHYIVTTKSGAVEIVYEAWFTPALNVALKYRMAVASAAGQKTETSATAIAIRPLPPGSPAP